MNTHMIYMSCIISYKRYKIVQILHNKNEFYIKCWEEVFFINI